MKIFYFVYWHDKRFRDRPGGPVKVFELCDNLKKLGHDVTLFIPDIGFPRKQTNAKVVAIPLFDLPLVRFLHFQIVSLLRALSIIAQTGKPSFFLVRIMWSFSPHLLAGLLGIPVFLEVNDSPHRAYAMMGSRIKGRLIHGIDRITYALSDHLFPVTQRIAGDIHRQEGVRAEKMTVLPSGTNTELFRPLDRKECCREIDLRDDCLYIGFIGTFFRYQGVDTLISCASHLIPANKIIRFLLVGDGPMRSTWEEMIHASGLDSYFILPGFIPYQRVPVYCGAMDVCVAPLNSEAGESSAVKIFDYLACGKPVIMSDIAGTGRSFRETGAVLLVPPEDPHALAESLKHLLESTAEMSVMGKKGRELVLDSYSRIKIAGDLADTAEKLVKDRRRS